MSAIDFDTAFAVLTGHPPFPWQRELYREFIAGYIRATASIPTGLGKTNVITVWLLALATNPMNVPRRLVYVVNRRTVVDQSTRVAEDIREKLPKAAAVEQALWDLCAVRPTKHEKQRNLGLRPLAISTLRGQFADNREWSADPSRPGIIAGTVDMIGSRLLFSGYGVGFKLKPLHAGFLGQDVLLVHDEAHLEKPFQDLLEAIECEQRGGRLNDQRRCLDAGLLRSDFRPMRVMALTATPRVGEQPFELTDEEKNPPDVIPGEPDPLHTVWRRLRSKKKLALISVADEDQVVSKIVDLAWKRGEEQPGSRVIVFVRTVNAVADVKEGLLAKKVPAANISTLTGTMRGLERTRQADPRQEKADPIFARFLSPPAPEEEPWKTVPQPGTVYLICTAAGEVGVDISADHLVCDLTPFDSMVQRFGRVNRYGTGEARIDVVYEGKPSEKKKDDPFDKQRWLTLQQLIDLRGDSSPYAIARLPLPDRIAAFTPTPTVLPVPDFLFDAWALTSIREKLPGRPMVEPYLHGISGWEPPETHVAWRKEVSVITGVLLEIHRPEDLLEDYPLKPHELLRDNSRRVFDRLEKLATRKETPVWIVSDDNSVQPKTLGELIKAGKDELNYKTVLLPPVAGGLDDNGMFMASSTSADDVADECADEYSEQRRARVWDNEEAPDGMRLIREIDTKPDTDEDADEETTSPRFWRWYELPKAGDSDGSQTSKQPVSWLVHTRDVMQNAERFIKGLPLPDDMKNAIILAAEYHDLGKRRELWQRSIGCALPKNPKLEDWLAKSGGKMKLPGFRTDYRHEFGSLVNVLNEDSFKALKDKPEIQDLILHLIAVHHGRGRPHFPTEQAFDPKPPSGVDVDALAVEVPQRFARLQRKYGRWGLAYLESLLRAADYAASEEPSEFVKDKP